MSSKTEEFLETIRASRREIMGRSLVWKHYKGGVYCIDGIVIDTDNASARVLYHRISGPGYNHMGEQEIQFARPLAEWFDSVDTVVDGDVAQTQRFIPVRKVEEWKEITYDR